MRFASIITMVLLASSVASATVWDDAINRGAPDPAQDQYDAEMRSGDEHALLANTSGATKKEVARHVQLAASAYRGAAAAKPDKGEPYYRLGRLIFSFYLECTDVKMPPSMRSLLCRPELFDHKRAEEVIEAWDAFEKREPLDPRLSIVGFGESEILFRRAILHTKLATKTHLAAAALDYEKILARDDGTDASETVTSNLAETYMMLGRLEESIEMYKLALRSASSTSTWYGYAVALDRDERTKTAFETIRALGPQARQAFYESVARGGTFYVPEGEKYYYFALVDEAFGADDDAIDNWQRFIKSGAHPEFHARAKEHLAGLFARKKRGNLPFDPPWRGLLR